MRKDLLSLGFALALGTIIGGLCADEIAVRFTYRSYFWGIGALLGGLIAWCVVDFQHFCAGVSRAWDDTITWWPDTLYWKALFAMSSGLAVLYCSVFGIGAAVYVCFANNLTAAIDGILTLMIFGTCFGVFLGTLFTVAIVGKQEDSEKYVNFLCHWQKLGLSLLKHCNPIGLLYWTVVYLPQAFVCVLAAMIAVCVKCIAACRIARAFAMRAFFYVQSERRMIALIFATAGAAVFHSFGSAIIGLVIGVGVGLLEYELVSVRRLKLFPARAK